VSPWLWNFLQVLFIGIVSTPLEYEGFETLNHAIISTVGNFQISIGEPVFDVIRGDLVISSVPFSYIYLF